MLLYGSGILSQQHLEMLYRDIYHVGFCVFGLVSMDLCAPELKCWSIISACICYAASVVLFGTLTLIAPAHCI